MVKTINDRVLERDNFCCRVCGTNQMVQVHHVRFRSRGGGNAEDNLVTLCWNCHEQVHDGKISLHVYQVDDHLELFIQRRALP